MRHLVVYTQKKLNLEMVNSKKNVSEILVSSCFNLFTIRTCFIKTIFSPPLLSLSLLRTGNWCPLTLNWLSERESSSFVLSTQRILIWTFLQISRRSSILFLSELMFKYPTTWLKRLFTLRCIRPSISRSMLLFPEVLTEPLV